jgi:hypothetical protein
LAHQSPRAAERRARVSALLRGHGLDASSYERSFDAMAADVSPAFRSTQSYVSFKRSPAGLRVTTYLSPRLFATPA